jgi:hypothetical protein
MPAHYHLRLRPGRLLLHRELPPLPGLLRLLALAETAPAPLLLLLVLVLLPPPLLLPQGRMCSPAPLLLLMLLLLLPPPPLLRRRRRRRRRRTLLPFLLAACWLLVGPPALAPGPVVGPPQLLASCPLRLRLCRPRLRSGRRPPWSPALLPATPPSPLVPCLLLPPLLPPGPARLALAQPPRLPRLPRLPRRLGLAIAQLAIAPPAGLQPRLVTPPIPRGAFPWRPGQAPGPPLAPLLLLALLLLGPLLLLLLLALLLLALPPAHGWPALL